MESLIGNPIGWTSDQLAEAQRVVEEQKRLESLTGNATGMATDQLAEAQRAFEEQRRWDALTAPDLISVLGAAPRVMEDFARAAASVRETFADSKAAFDQVGRDILAVRSAFLSWQDQIRLQLENASSALSQLRSFPPAVTDVALGLRDFATWTRDINCAFQLRLPLTTLSAAAAISSGQVGDPEHAVAAANLLRPGFQTLATAGLEGLAAPSAVSDLLARYDEPLSSTTPIFNSALQGIKALDFDGDGSDVEEGLRSAGVVILQHIHTLRGGIRSLPATGWIALWSAAMATMSAYHNYTGGPQLKQGIENLRTELKQGFADQLNQIRANRSVRHVQVTTVLRAGPSHAAEHLRFVFPDQTIMVLQANGDWAEVEIYDYQTEKTIRGWIGRRLLR